MNAGFFKRLGAYIIDILIISLVLSLITTNLNKNTEHTEKISQLTSKYASGEITQKEFLDEYKEESYYNQKDNIISNICQFTLIFGYFVIFQGLNKGQTIGKKLLKIRLVNEEDNNSPPIGKILLRSILIYSVLSSLLNIVCIKYLKMHTYITINEILTSIETIFLIITIFFIIYNKEKRGLHDIITHTKVIKE